jgi:hypothetical protein
MFVANEQVQKSRLPAAIGADNPIKPASGQIQIQAVENLGGVVGKADAPD